MIRRALPRIAALMLALAAGSAATPGALVALAAASSPAKSGDGYEVFVKQCAPGFVETADVSGTVTNTSEERRTFRVEVRLERRHRLVGGLAVFVRNVRPGEGRDWGFTANAEKRKGKLRCRVSVTTID